MSFDVVLANPAPALANDMPTNAAHPFNNFAAADAILRSSDGVDFWVRKSILAEASCIFEDMLRIPLPPPGSPTSDEFRNGLPVIQLAERAGTLDRLLRLCYPVDDPAFKTLDDLRPALEAARKYMMAEATTLLRRRLVRLGQATPLRAFAVACALGLPEEADALAPQAHKAFGLFVEEFGEMSAGVYFRLAHLHPPPPCQKHPKKTTATGRGCAPCSILVPPSSPALSARELGRPASEPVPPFLPNLGGADVLLESSDGVQFRVHSAILSLASMHFSRMIQEHCGDGELLEPNADPIILPEDCRTLSALLTYIYPLPPPPPPPTWDTLRAQLEAAHKYDIACALTPLRTFLLTYLPSDDAPGPGPACAGSTFTFASTRTSPTPTDTDPGALALRVFAVAHQLGLAPERMAAARALLRISGDALRTTYVPELEELDAATYFRLRQYHDRCGHAAAECVRHHALAYHAGTPFQGGTGGDGGGGDVSTSAPPSPTRPADARSRSGSDSSTSPARPVRGQSRFLPSPTGSAPSAPTPACTTDYADAARALRQCARGGGRNACQVVLDERSAPAWARFRRECAPRWWLMYVYKLGVLVRARPWAGGARDGVLKRRALARMVECEGCRGRFLLGFDAYVEHVAGEIEKAVAEVKLDIK